jgi:uncharacterized membrane protein YjjP (DUF1212 family)
MSSQKRPLNNNQLLLKYAGLTMQLMVGLGIALFAGYQFDRWLNFATPLFVWMFPLLFIVGLIYKVIKDTSKKNNV